MNDRIKEYLSKILEYDYDVKLNEGFDINGKKVSYNQNHDDNLDTASVNLREIYSYKIKDPVQDKYWDVISFFIRVSGEHEDDGNPVIYALKKEKNYELVDRAKVLKIMADQFYKIAYNSKLLVRHYDTIVVAPTSSWINRDFTEKLLKHVSADKICRDLLEKRTKEDVKNNFIDWDAVKKYADKNHESFESVKTKLLNSFKNMGTYFRYHDLKNIEYRNFIKSSLKIPGIENSKMYDEYSNYFNDKNILVLDDSLATGKTISDVCNTIMETFKVKKITIATLMSIRVNKNDIKRHLYNN